MGIWLWRAQKKRLCLLIKKVAEQCGEEDIEWLREYCKEVVKANQDDLLSAIRSVEEIEKQLKFLPKREKGVLRETSDGVREEVRMDQKREEIQDKIS